jgi:transposase InsO family protein
MEASREAFSVRRMCSLLEVSASGYYAWRERAPSERARANEGLVKEIKAIHAESHEAYGSPRVHAELLSRGFRIGKNRVARLMQVKNIQSRRKRKRQSTTDSRHNYPIAPNLLQQNFQAAIPNEKWLSDITYIPTAEGWLYLAAILDLFSRKIVGWAMEDHMESELVELAFQMAVKNRQKVSGLLHHSDRGSQYAGGVYQTLIQAHRVTPSMSRTGNCYDNAPMESFFSTLKCELVDGANYQTRAEARTDIFAYIEGFYNRNRLHSSLGYLSPEEFERRFHNLS